MIDEIVDTMVDVTMEFEELDAKECKGVFVSGRNTLEIWHGDKLMHLRIFIKDGYSEFTFPDKEVDKIISKLKLLGSEKE